MANNVSYSKVNPYNSSVPLSMASSQNLQSQATRPYGGSVLGTNTSSLSNASKYNLQSKPVNMGSVYSQPQTPSNTDLVQLYRNSGWTDMNAINADIAAGGASKFTGGGGNGGGRQPSKYDSSDPRAGLVASDPTARQDFENSGLNMDEYLDSIDREYNASNDYLNTAEANINADKTSTLANLETQRGALKEQAYTKKEDAQTAARRLYSELQQGHRQRFGGASSAGEAAMALTNNEQQRQMATNNRSYQDSLVQIDISADSAIASAQTEFRNLLAQITQNRTSLVSQKEQAKRQALQKLSDQVFQVQQQRQTLKDNITLMQEQARINNANNLSKLSNNPGSNLGFGDGTTKYASGNNSNFNLLGATGIASYGGNIRYTDGTIRDQYGNIIR